MSESTADLLVACAFPSVVIASANRAKTLKRIADRQLLFQHFSGMSMSMALEEAAQKARQRDGVTARHLAFLLEDPVAREHEPDEG